jgi:protease I
MVPAAVEFARSLSQAGKPAAVVCHGPWTLVEAGLARGRTLTSLPSLQTNIRNAAGTWGEHGGPRVHQRAERTGDQPQA